MADGLQKQIKISIHIPRVGDDYDTLQSRVYRLRISIHIPRVGDDRV